MKGVEHLCKTPPTHPTIYTRLFKGLQNGVNVHHERSPNVPVLTSQLFKTKTILKRRKFVFNYFIAKKFFFAENRFLIPKLSQIREFRFRSQIQDWTASQLTQRATDPMEEEWTASLEINVQSRVSHWSTPAANLSTPILKFHIGTKAMGSCRDKRIKKFIRKWANFSVTS